MEPKPPAETLLANRRWLRRLAAQLVRGTGGDADDVLQDTWLAALAAPARSASRAWLTVVARNAARQRARRAAGRREQALPSNEELADRARTQRDLADHVLALPDPYRRAILLRYFEGLKPGAIAAREAVPLPTVKTWLRRGLERLRVRLDEAHGDRGAWVALLSPWLPKSVLAATGVGVILMGGKWSVAAVSAAVLLGLGALLWNGRAETYPPRPGPQNAGVAAQGPAIKPARPHGGGLRPGAADAVRQPLPAEASASSAPGALRVRVLDASDRSALPGAEVWVASMEQLRAHVAEDHAPEDPAGLVMEHGTRGVADAQGLVAFPHGRRLIVARHRVDGRVLFGLGNARGDPDELVELALARDRTLRFQTVDPEGRPLPGVPAGVTTAQSRGNPEVVTFTEGPQALGEIRHYDAIFAPQIQRGDDLILTLPFPLTDPVRVHLRDLDFAEPVRLVVPPTGSVRLDVLDEAGRPLDGDLVSILALPALAGTEINEAAWWRMTARAQAGVVTLERVGLGLVLDLTLSSRDPLREARLGLRGPTREGQQVRAELSYAPPPAVLLAALVDPQGEPLAERRGSLLVDLDGPEGRVVQGVELRTDAEGRMEVTLPDAAVRATTGQASIRLFARDDLPQRSGSLDAVFPMSLGGRRDLGTVALGVTPRVAQGRVIDDAGQPVPRAQITVLRHRGGRSEWVHNTGVQCDEQGSFSLHADLEPGRHELRAQLVGYLAPAMVPFALGDELEIVLLRAAELKGQLLVAEGVPAQGLFLHATSLEREVDWPASASARRTVALGNGRFALDALYPGRTELRMTLKGSEVTLLRREVMLEAGANETEALDLRPLLVPLTVAVVDADGGPVPRGFLQVGPDRGEDTRRVAFQEGRARLTVTELPVDLRVFADGFLPGEELGVDRSTTVALERGGHVVLRLPESFDLPLDPGRLQVALVPRSEYESMADASILTVGLTGQPGHRWRLTSHRPMNATGEIRIPVGAPGEYRVLWSLLAPEGTRLERHSQLEPPGAVVTLRGEGETLTLAPDPEAYRAAREALD